MIKLVNLVKQFGTFTAVNDVWLELLLEQERADEVRKMNNAIETHLLAITEFSLFSDGIITTQKSQIFYYPMVIKFYSPFLLNYILFLFLLIKINNGND